MFKTSIFLLSVLVLGAIADDEHGKDVVTLSKDTFDADVGKKPHFVMFFAPWYVGNFNFLSGNDRKKN